MRQRGLFFLLGMIGVIVADGQYVIWTASSTNAFDWKPGRRTYPSMEVCERAIASRHQWLARKVEVLRRIEAEETILHAFGDRIYRCLPADDASSKR